MPARHTLADHSHDARLEKQWLPSLQASLTRIEQALEQAERDDATRLRRAAKAPLNGGMQP